MSNSLIFARLLFSCDHNTLFYNYLLFISNWNMQIKWTWPLIWIASTLSSKRRHNKHNENSNAFRCDWPINCWKWICLLQLVRARANLNDVMLRFPDFVSEICSRSYNLYWAFSFMATHCLAGKFSFNRAEMCAKMDIFNFEIQMKLRTVISQWFGGMEFVHQIYVPRFECKNNFIYFIVFGVQVNYFVVIYVVRFVWKFSIEFNCPNDHHQCSYHINWMRCENEKRRFTNIFFYPNSKINCCISYSRFDFHSICLGCTPFW